MSTMTRKYLLTIDLGTSGPKVALVSTDGEILGCEFEETPLLLLPDGGAEQRPGDWWAAIVAAARRLLARGLAPPDDVVAICCTAQWSGTVAVDAAGQPLMNALIWMDSRGQRYVGRVTGGPLRIQGYGVGKLLTWLRATGGVPTQTGKDSIAHILYLKHERPEIYAAAYKFLEPKDYLNLRLTGRYAASYDSITLHWLTNNRDIANIAYDERLLSLTAIDRAKLPDLRRAIDVLGPLTPEAARELGLPAGVQVVVGTPDIHSAAIGAGSVRDYDANLYIGTSSWLTCHVPFKKTDLLHNMASLPSAIPGRYLLINEQECAGICLTFLRDNLVFPDDGLSAARPANAYQLFDALAAQAPPGSDRVIFTPWLNGERTPIDDHTVRGAFYNLSLHTTRAQMIRAVLEGVAYNTRWLLRYVEQFVGRRLQAINIVGGGAASAVWCQIHADVLGRTIRQVADPIQINVRGAALLAAVALGYASFEDVGSWVRIARVFEPQPQHQPVYDAIFREYVNIYKLNRGIYARLNGG